jgi:hypothetical protein
MNIIPQVEADEIRNLISDKQQSPLISTLEKREDVENVSIEPTIITSSEISIPITIDIDSKPVEQSIEVKIVCQLFLKYFHLTT